MVAQHKPPRYESIPEMIAFHDEKLSGRDRGGWAALGEMLGVDKGTAWSIAHGKRKMTKRQALRWSMVLDMGDAFDGTVEFTDAIPCQTCGIVHGSGLNCYGQIGIIAFVPVNARIVRRNAPRRIQDMTVKALTFAIENRKECV